MLTATLLLLLDFDSDPDPDPDPDLVLVEAMPGPVDLLLERVILGCEIFSLGPGSLGSNTFMTEALGPVRDTVDLAEDFVIFTPKLFARSIIDLMRSNADDSGGT